MSFAAPLFLWYFLPAVLLLHWLTPHSWRNAILAISSIAFYLIGGKEFVLLLLALMVINYAAGLAIERALNAGGRGRGILVGVVVADLAVLAVWKYLGFASTILNSLTRHLGGGTGTTVVHLALPIGISFFTFHHLSYVVDVYRRERPAMRNPLTFATYIAMFPQLIAGPIVRYNQIADQLNVQRHQRWADFGDAFPRFAWGLLKKVVIADSLAPIADAAFAAPHPSAATAWIGALAYTGQIYFDFSGYSDMAIGLAHMFGLRLPENFRRPYSAHSVTDFWRRWHISLSGWFRDYVYIPLGGNRGGGVATYRNLTIVFLLTGLWHGAAWTFVLWGMYHGAWLVFERATGLARSKRLIGPRRALTFFVVVVGWVLFRAGSLGEFARMIKAMLSLHGLTKPHLGIDPDLALNLGSWQLALLVLVLLTALLPGQWVVGRMIDGLDDVPRWRTATARGVAVLASPYAAAAAVAGTFSPFLYFQF